MPRNYDAVDIDWSFDGDLLLDKTGDLKDTSEDSLLSFRNEILTIVKSDLEDWREEPAVGADLGDFVGEPNTPLTAKAIQERVSNSLLLICSQQDLSVRVIPVGVHKVLVAINIQVMATPKNGLRVGDSLTVSFLYDYFERGVFVPIEDMNKFSGRKI